MIRFKPAPEPAEFDKRVRKPGRAWLAKHRSTHERPRDYWLRFRHKLAEAFHHLCAYSAIHVSYPGVVDHFRPVRGKHARRDLAYEWSNYRYASQYLNSRKGDRDPDTLLDPFEVRDGWFELLLPSCQLVLTPACPPKYRQRARVMLEKLGLGHDEDVVRYRRQWLEQYEEGRLNLKGLEEFAPLLARAVRKANLKPAPRLRVSRGKRARR